MSRLSMIDEDMVTLDDGFKYYWPDGAIGCFTSADLRMIANRVDELNANWQAQIELDLALTAETSG